MSVRMTSLGARPVPRRLAGVLAELELLAPETVTREDIENAIEAAGGPDGTSAANVEAVIDGLRRAGWLLPLRTRGVWEFAPGNRSGAFRSGDPFTELRAALAMRPGWCVAVGMESAAFLRRLAEHPPSPDVVIAPTGTRQVGALRTYRLVRIELPNTASADLDDLPVHTIAALLAAMAIVPRGYGDWPNVPTWLPNAVARICAADPEPGDGGMNGESGLRQMLEGASAAAWARAAYLIEIGGQPDASRCLQNMSPTAATGPVYLGPRNRPGRYHHRTCVYDSLVGAL
jgi:hypothetical protein